MAVDSSRWGILYCPRKSNGGSRKHREKLEGVLASRKVEYDIVQSESTESVERLVRMLVNNGYKTIVIVGGDTALNDAVNCLMHINPTPPIRTAASSTPGSTAPIPGCWRPMCGSAIF